MSRNAALGRSDLVIGMTLAEFFLLLLFVIWWYHAKMARAGEEPLTVQLQVLQAENAALQIRVKSQEQRIAQLEAQLRDREARLEALRAMLGSTGTDTTSMREAFNRQLQTAVDIVRRGAPKCLEKNTLLAASVRHGEVVVTILSADPGVLAQLRQYGAGDIQPGTVYREWWQISGVLRAVQRYYGHNPECRFDYRLSYNTAEDYKLGRTQFEGHFYPERLVELP